MNVKEELEKMEEEIRASLPNFAATRPELIPKMAATALASKHKREGKPAAVPCPVCGEILNVSSVGLDNGKGVVWVGCKNGCTFEKLNYG
ncbi:MAG: hypothetical protein ABIQ44_03300, partial [Chloroflexia bacterium]